MALVEATVSRHSSIFLPNGRASFSASIPPEGAVFESTKTKLKPRRPTYRVTGPDELYVTIPGTDVEGSIIGETINSLPPVSKLTATRHNLTEFLYVPDVATSEMSPEHSYLADELEDISKSQKRDVTRLQRWVQTLGATLDNTIPPGAIAEAFTNSILALGTAATLYSGKKEPVVAALQGLLGGCVGNTLGSVATHRAIHGSVEFKPGALEVVRLANALVGGSRPTSFAPMHTVHHDSADTENDPQSPAHLGRWKVFFGINALTHKFVKEHPELVAQAQANPAVRKMPFENYATTALGIAGTHWALGEKFNQPLKYRALSAAIHVASLYVIGGTFAADGHLEGTPRDFNFSMLTKLLMGGEEDHEGHHDDPSSPRHADVDPGYAVAWLFKQAGLATFPART